MRIERMEEVAQREEVAHGYLSLGCHHPEAVVEALARSVDRGAQLEHPWRAQRARAGLEPIEAPPVVHGAALRRRQALRGRALKTWRALVYAETLG